MNKCIHYDIFCTYMLSTKMFTKLLQGKNLFKEFDIFNCLHFLLKNWIYLQNEILSRFD